MMNWQEFLHKLNEARSHSTRLFNMDVSYLVMSHNQMDHLLITSNMPFLLSSPTKDIRILNIPVAFNETAVGVTFVLNLKVITDL